MFEVCKYIIKDEVKDELEGFKEKAEGSSAKFATLLRVES
jgi:hypothetical protein